MFLLEYALNDFKYTRVKDLIPVTVTERSKAYTVFVRSDAGIVGLNPTHCMDV
jgi:hypothetical protein